MENGSRLTSNLSDPIVAEPARPLATVPGRRVHHQVLLVSTAVVVLSFLLEVRPDERVCLRGMRRWALPPSCASRTWFGTDCPGCGLTRAMVHLAHADWNAAFRTHRLAGVLAFTILLQFPYRILCLSQGRPPLGTLAPRLYGHFLIAALIVNWLVGQFIGIRAP
jgi:hypothetical protein